MNQEFDNYLQCSQKPALVVGANGFVGSHITRLLTAAQRNVRVLVRKSSNLTSIEGLPVERHLGDVSDVESLKSAMRGCGTVFYCVVDTRAWLTDPTPLYRCNVDGLANAIDAAQAEGIERFVFTSSMATIGRVKQGMASESDAFNWWDVAPDYIQSRVEAENKLLEACRNSAFPGIALCVANTYGPGDHQPTPHGGMLWQAATGRASMALDCAAPTVDIRDAAEAALLAERYGRVGERYIVSNRFIGQPDLYALAAAAHGGGKAPRTVNLKFVYALAAVNEFFAKLSGRKDTRLCRNAIFLSEVFGPLDNTKIREELGWQPRPLEETVKDAVAWFSDHQPVNN